MRLSPARFNAMLGTMGQAALWRRASLCPCRDPYSGQPRPDCPHCEGRGIAWGGGVAATTGLAGMRVVRQFADFGRWMAGDVVLTVPSNSPLWDARENDRVLLSQSSEPYTAVMERDGDERVRGQVYALDSCWWLNPSGAVVQGAIPAIAADGKLSWADPAQAPEPGTQFSLSGRRRPEYFIFTELPQDRAHFGGLPLPRRIQARKFDLFGKSS